MTFKCSQTETAEFAALAPEAATAGTPIPGNVESPHMNNPGTSDTLGYGNFSSPALSAGP
eukprot:CAMPEP_0113944762 /NCGR_PEP_ID=MMETSP1339-20121228/36588_1 /TAXON_ID=94617 /ORGANISM="Fibrocapsa japonica" /LENGTH=59 /DNA_ID=CAMNT_0000950075 /DNA_START=234 /DNA_END=413 /DNA_ORIENTATION=+ /assembly_acc=CAM_ASM_000762